MTLFIYTSYCREPKSSFYSSLLPNLERQDLVTWRFGGVLVAQGGSVTFDRCLRIVFVLVFFFLNTEVRFKSLRRPLLGGLIGGSCLKVSRVTG